MEHPQELSSPSRCPNCQGTSWLKVSIPKAPDSKEIAGEEWRCSTCLKWLYELAEMDAPKKTRNIDTEWESFREKTIPKEASDGQVHDQHMAFLAGAASLMDLINCHSDDEGINILQHVQRQIDAAITANRIRSMAHEERTPPAAS